jgi:hypothetical protein
MAIDVRNALKYNYDKLLFALNAKVKRFATLYYLDPLAACRKFTSFARFFDIKIQVSA